MLRRRVVGRALVRTAAVGGVAYAAGHHVATKSAEQQQMEAQQNAQIADLQQQAAAAPPYYQQPAPPPPVYQQPAPPPPQAAGLTTDDIAQLKQLGDLHESGVLTDAEFEAAKQKILGS
jgi:Short C-terminal domain